VPGTTWIAVVAVTELAVKPVIVANAPSTLSPAWGTLPRPDTTIVVPPLAGPVAGTTLKALGGGGGTGTVPGTEGVVPAGVVPVGVVVGDAAAAVLGADGFGGTVVEVVAALGVKISGFDGTLSPKTVKAVTSNWYAVPLVKPPTDTPVAVVCATSAEPRYTRYPIAPGTADHCRITLESPADPMRFIGPTGGGGRVVLLVGVGAGGADLVVVGVAAVVEGVADFAVVVEGAGVGEVAGGALVGVAGAVVTVTAFGPVVVLAPDAGAVVVAAPGAVVGIAPGAVVGVAAPGAVVGVAPGALVLDVEVPGAIPTWNTVRPGLPTGTPTVVSTSCALMA
jgi:hypothetical protein